MIQSLLTPSLESRRIAAPIVDLRPSMTAHLTQRLNAFAEGFRHNVAVLGPAGTGKSYLVQQALRAAQDGFLKIYCPLQPMSLQGFMRLFAMAVLRAVVREGEELDLTSLVDRAASLAPKTVEAAQQLTRPAGHAHVEAFTHALDLVSVLHKELQRPCLLVLDEFLHLGDLSVSHAFHELGKRVITWPYTLFLVTSSSSLHARDILRERLQLLFGQFELVCLGPTELGAASSWVQQQLPGGAERTDLGRFLLHWTGSFTWSLKVLVKRMKELQQRDGQALNEAMVVQAAWDTLGSPDGVLYHWSSAQLLRLAAARHGALAREALFAIARGERTSQAIADHCQARSHLSQALQLLVEEDLVARKGACWVIPDQLFAFWLGAVYDPFRDRRQGDLPAVADRFEWAFRALLSSWVRASHLSLAERIGGLFTQFHNETVSLDHKTGRLPAFRTVRTLASSDVAEVYLVADGESHRWCALIHEGRLEEPGVAAFERFCQTQSPRPSRRVVVANEGLELNAKLLAKESNMWVWEPDDINLLCLLYGQPALERP